MGEDKCTTTCGPAEIAPARRKTQSVRIQMVENGFLIHREGSQYGTLIAGDLDEAMRLTRLQFQEVEPAQE
ncbi:MAG: hypothetical protein PHC53_02565 [Patescibacteria group bacterium]|nr:hypothetical protein [Patescibacteria group bacterium]